MITFRCSIRILVLFFVLISQVIFAQQAKQKTNAPAPNSTSVTWKKQFRQGFSLKTWMSNDLLLGVQAWDGNVPPDACGSVGLGMVYQPNSCDELLYGAGPMIGGKTNGVVRVSQTYNGNTGSGDFIPNPADSLRNKIWVTSATDSTIVETGYYKTQMNKRFVDDDSDGKIDEDALDGEDNDNDWNIATDDLGVDGLADLYEEGCKGVYDPILNPDPAFDNWNPAKKDSCHPTSPDTYLFKRSKDRYTQGNGIPEHGEPHVDEDYAAISDQDVYMYATDTNTISPTSHVPMNVKIIQKSYAWKNKEYDGILPFEYEFVNIGRDTIEDVYLGFYVDADVGSSPLNNYGGYFDSIRTVFVSNPDDPNSTPLGFTILETSLPVESLKYTLQWNASYPPCGGTTDAEVYSCMSCAAFGNVDCIRPEHADYVSDVKFLISYGPFPEMKPGDTLRTTVAFVSGTLLSVGPQSLRAHAEQAIKKWSTRWRQNVTLPSPCLEITSEKEGIKLKWNVEKPGCINPMETWDDSNKLAETYPPDHWRLTNPPPGHTRGGRIFEGFRLYRSEDPLGSTESFVFMKQYDVIDDFAFNVGIETSFIDSFARKGNTYGYAVTSFSIPSLTIFPIPISGGVLYDTLYGDSYESSISENATKVYYSFGPSTTHGEVLVVPNPYRGSEYYVNGDGYEGLERDWTPYKRKVRFIHLPPKATIRIYSLVGDIITVINHDEAAGNTPGQHDFHLFSESGRPLANGIYPYTVESEFGKQIGKFIIAR